MLSVNSLDFLSYKNALKGNYRKGVFTFRAILENPATAEAFASNPGGVALVLGWPIGHEDHNSAELLELLLGSSVIDQATLTWMAQWYPDDADSWDTLASGLDRATFIAANALLWRAVGRSPMASGKVIATLAGLTCSQYADIAAVAADESAMEAVAASQVAMTAVAASQVAMTAVAASQVAMAAVKASPTAMAAICASDVAITKYAASAAGANYSQFDTFTALAADSTAMGKVAASEVAMTAVAASTVAMTAVAASTVAMTAVGNSQTALNALAASDTALDALYARKTRMEGVSKTYSGKVIVLEISSNNAFNVASYGYATLSDGTQPDWSSYKGKYAFFKQFKKVATAIKNDNGSDDWIDYFKIS